MHGPERPKCERGVEDNAGSPGNKVASGGVRTLGVELATHEESQCWLRELSQR